NMQICLYVKRYFTAWPGTIPAWRNRSERLRVSVQNFPKGGSDEEFCPFGARRRLRCCPKRNRFCPGARARRSGCARRACPSKAETNETHGRGHESPVEGMLCKGRRPKAAWQGAKRVPRKVQARRDVSALVN